jgi:hypothetical protein
MRHVGQGQHERAHRQPGQPDQAEHADDGADDDAEQRQHWLGETEGDVGGQPRAAQPLRVTWEQLLERHDEHEQRHDQQWRRPVDRYR